MLRRFNYTGRKKIPRAAVSVSLDDRQVPPSFDAKIDLSSVELPGTARVYLEAYYRASYMRFDFGCVSDLRAPQERILYDIENGGTPQFRVKVVDETTEHGCVLAEADSIDALVTNDENSDRIPLLPVSFVDLGDEVWRLELETGDGRPVLELNKNIECMSLVSITDDAFFCLVYPQIVRQVLTHILIELRFADRDGPADKWEVQWLQFASSLPGVLWQRFDDREWESEIEQANRARWIEDVTRAFSRVHRVAERFGRARAGGAN